MMENVMNVTLKMLPPVLPQMSQQDVIQDITLPMVNVMNVQSKTLSLVLVPLLLQNVTMDIMCNQMNQNVVQTKIIVYLTLLIVFVTYVAPDMVTLMVNVKNVQLTTVEHVMEKSLHVILVPPNISLVMMENVHHVKNTVPFVTMLQPVQLVT